MAADQGPAVKKLGEWIAILEAASEKSATKLELAKAQGMETDPSKFLGVMRVSW